jgi:malonate transporter MadL subunit
MIIYGVAILSFCYLLGQILGELIGRLIGVEANVGGVGFAMIILILTLDWLRKNNKLSQKLEEGIQFWRQMYIPIIIAMAATQNVKAAVSSGLIALAAGIIPVILCFLFIPVLTKLSNK